jgi:DNA-binding GntR family transcriptional regulator
MKVAASNSRYSEKLDELSRAFGRKASMSEQIAQLLRSLIITGELNPGDRIVESRVARQLGVGQPTVREALVQLEHQGLVVRKVNQGCIVTALTREEISHICRIRAELEVLAVELAVENASDSDLQQLVVQTQRMKVAAQARNTSDFFAHDLVFHEILWKLSGNPFLSRSLSPLMLPLLAFLFIRNLRNHSHIDLLESAAAHEDIVEAILTRDKDHARQVLQQKLQMFYDQHVNLFDDREVRAS